jgi:hypothetical protein
MTDQQRENTSARYISLTAASALIYHAATDAITDDAGTLNHLARIICTRTHLLARAADNDPFTPVRPKAVFEGRFEEGGKCLCFPDGRPTLRNLAIPESEMARLIAELRPLLRAELAAKAAAPAPQARKR